ncbi:hypothetical protein CYLTODRAFT_389499 [Cylindrobasidium torrendii FP15055 ss-10]|uniref:Wax synthase domain-containing protein n=1 Tax=Cylindrobasidium torrendii FP15055 ss-10 TaxID=1314674 RepID=A0A0D7BNF2_9AGAR|nr:hypothetical protein CYLTODRAFT_389499 [Cylindrobasidium torrendii FP15055 ss-10]
MDSLYATYPAMGSHNLHTNSSLPLQILHGCRDGAIQAFRTIIPEPQNRIPITPAVAPEMLVSLLPYLFLAYLARREGTYLIRLLLLPSVLTSSLWSAFAHVWTQPRLNVYNWGQCLMAIYLCGRSLEFALTPEGMLKLDEIRPGVSKGKASSNGSAYIEEVQPSSTWIPKWFGDAMELAHTLRGLQFKFGRNMHLPHDSRPMERGPFLKATGISFIQHFLIVDILETILKLFPGVGSVEGGSMFYPELSIIPRYATSTLIHMITGTCLLSGFYMVYHLVTLFAVGIVGDKPSQWPPVLDNPWISESLHELWATRWHQLLRQTFLVYGGYPGRWIAGNLGMLFGVFIASGLFHELGMYGMGHGIDHATIKFFMAQAPFMMLERVFKRVTGRRIHGWPGRLWVYLIMYVLAQPMIDSWHRRGLGGGMIIPPPMSPARILIKFFSRNYSLFVYPERSA